MGLAELLCNERVLKVCFNAQVSLMPFLGWLISRGQCFPSFFRSLADPKIAAWLTQTTLKESELEFTALVSTFITDPSQIPPAEEVSAMEAGGAVTRAVRSVGHMLRTQAVLWAVLRDKMEVDGCLQTFMEVEMPLVSLLSSMEVHGIGFQADKVAPLTTALSDRRVALAAEIHRLAGCEFNVDSPEQVSEVLYGRLKLPQPPPGKKHASTSEEVLQRLQGRHPVVALILRHRTLSKTQHTYLEPFPLHATSEGPMSRLRPSPHGNDW